MSKRPFFLVTGGAIFVLVVLTGALLVWPYIRGAYERSGLQLVTQGVLTVGVDAPYEPMEFFAEDGSIVGMDIDIAREIADHLGVRLAVKDVSWDELFDTLKSGKIDLAISTISITPERSEEMLFSHPYFDGGQTIVIRSNDLRIKTPHDLKTVHVGVQPETVSYDEIVKYVDKSLITEYKDFDISKDSLIARELLSGRIDAIVTDYFPATRMIVSNPGLRIAGEPFTQEFYGIAAKNGSTELIQEVNELLNTLKTSDKLMQIKNKWLNMQGTE